MTLSNDSLIRRFVEGGDSGKCNRMAISREGDWTLLWGFGHALYAARKDEGPLFVYEGWYGRSQTTSTHLNNLKGKARKTYVEVDDPAKDVCVTVDGDGGAEIEGVINEVVLAVVEEGRPGLSYGRFGAGGRPELSHLSRRRIEAPSGTSGH